MRNGGNFTSLRDAYQPGPLLQSTSTLRVRGRRVSLCERLHLYNLTLAIGSSLSGLYGWCVLLSSCRTLSLNHFPEQWKVSPFVFAHDANLYVTRFGFRRGGRTPQELCYRERTGTRAAVSPPLMIRYVVPSSRYIRPFGDKAAISHALYTIIERDQRLALRCKSEQKNIKPLDRDPSHDRFEF